MTITRKKQTVRVSRRCPYCGGDRKYNNLTFSRHQDSQICQRNGRRKISYAQRYLRNPYPFDDVLRTQFYSIGNPTEGVVAIRDGFLLEFDRATMVAKFTYEFLTNVNRVSGELIPYRDRAWIQDLDLPLDCIYPRDVLSPRPDGYHLAHLCTYALHQHNTREKIDNILMSIACLMHKNVNLIALSKVEQIINGLLHLYQLHIFSGPIVDSEPLNLSRRVGGELEIPIPDFIFKIFAFRLFADHYYYEAYRFVNNENCPENPEESRVEIDVIAAATDLTFFNRIPRTHLHTKEDVNTTLNDIIDRILAQRVAVDN